MLNLFAHPFLNSVSQEDQGPVSGKTAATQAHETQVAQVQALVWKWVLFTKHQLKGYVGWDEVTHYLASARLHHQGWVQGTLTFLAGDRPGGFLMYVANFSEFPIVFSAEI